MGLFIVGGSLYNTVSYCLCSICERVAANTPPLHIYSIQYYIYYSIYIYTVYSCIDYIYIYMQYVYIYIYMRMCTDYVSAVAVSGSSVTVQQLFIIHCM